MSEQANFMQVVRGGLCFAHGPYPDYQCPKWPACGIDPQKSEYLAEWLGKPGRKAPAPIAAPLRLIQSEQDRVIIYQGFAAASQSTSKR